MDNRKEMIRACIDGNLEKVKLIHSYGRIYHEAIIYASDRGHLEVVKFLLENGYYATEENNEPICVASCGGHEETVKLLLEYGADPKAKQNDPLICAGAKGYSKIVEILLEAGAEIPDSETMRVLCFKSKIKDILARWKYRVDGPEYQQMKELI